MLDMLLTTSPKYHPLPKTHIPLLSNIATKKQTQRNFKTPHTPICTTSSYHMSRRRALSPVQQKRQPSRPPLSLNAPPLPCKQCKCDEESKTPLQTLFLADIDTTRGRRRRRGINRGESKARKKSVGRFYSKGWPAEGARHPKVGPAPRSSFPLQKHEQFKIPCGPSSPLTHSLTSIQSYLILVNILSNHSTLQVILLKVVGECVLKMLVFVF